MMEMAHMCVAARIGTNIKGRSIINQITIILITVFIMCQSELALAGESKLSTGNSLCTAESVELFSCKLKSEKSIALCVNKRNLKSNYSFIGQDKRIKNLPVSNFNQIVGSRSSGGSTIVKGDTNGGVSLSG